MPTANIYKSRQSTKRKRTFTSICFIILAKIRHTFGLPVLLHPTPATVVPDESHDALHDKEHHKGQQNEADYVGYYDHFG